MDHFRQPQLQPLHVLIIEKDAHTARILELGLRKRVPDVVVRHDTEVSSVKESYAAVDVALINHSLHADSFSRCFLLNRNNPAIKVLILTAPGDEMRHFEQLREQTGLIHAVVEKPLKLTALAELLDGIARQKFAAQSRQLGRLQRHLPAGLSVDELDNALNGDAVCSEKTVLFVDIRRSTEILRKLRLDEFFRRLNRYLAHLSGIVERNKGEIIKYTGDGMLVLFSGFARRYLGFRCARELLGLPGEDREFSIGLGLTDGLVMLGFIGTENRLFYDVIGGSVNIAARFCAEAKAGEVLMSDEIMRASALDPTEFTSQRLAVKGLDEPVLCHRYLTRTQP